MKELTEEEFKKLEKPSFDLELDRDKSDNNIKDIYRNLIEILKEWCDLKKEYYNIIALWIMGTYMHDLFPSFPYLFFNAMRGSGKTRLLSLIKILSKDGSLLNSLTEAELFRSRGTLAIDEFEAMGRKGSDNLRELLNSGYKKGAKVRRLRKVKTKDGEDYAVEEFDVYRPVVIANISGMDDVLSDRCITLILEKSSKSDITNLIEIFEHDFKIKKTKKLLEEFNKNRCSVCGVEMFLDVYIGWNSYIHNIHTLHNNIQYTQYTQLYESIKSAEINGRELELSLPLFITSFLVDALDITLETIKEIMIDRRSDSLIENRDISLYDFLSQEPENNYFNSVNELTNKFKSFLQTNDESINSRWMGIALKRLNLIIEKRRLSRGVEVKIDYKRASDKMVMFR